MSMPQFLRASALAVLAVALCPVGNLLAQSGEPCTVELVRADNIRQLDVAPGRVHVFVWGDVRARCIGQATTMTADSAARYSERRQVNFHGSVSFRDSTMEMFADQAIYYELDDRVEAFGNVRLFNRLTGSVLSGPQLVYLRAVAGVRDMTQLTARGRPRVEYRTTGGGEDPYVIVGDRVLLEGESRAWTGGNVTIDRKDLSARADSAWLDLDSEEGLLVGHAQAASRDSLGYTLSGETIAFRLTDDELRWVRAQGRADATSAEWRIVGDTIEFQVADDQIQSGQAWGDSTRSRAMSEVHTFTADSLAVDTPEQMLEEVRGFGEALATSKPDSLSIEADWMSGDTLVARFEPTETGGRTLAELSARGNARVFYHVPNDEDPEGPPGLDYSRGDRITALFRNETVDRVTVIGKADGVYLEPVRRQP